MSDNNQTIAVEYKRVEELRVDPFNPRSISKEQLGALARSIQEFGFVDPIIVRRSDGLVVGGHQRLVAAKRLGLSEIPVIQVDLDEEQTKLLNLALNRISGEWDEEILARLLRHLDEQNADLALSGFEDDELARLLQTLEDRDKRERVESFDLEAAIQEIAKGRVSRGDVWLLGRHRLMCGDATDAGDVQRLVGREAVALAFTDPPYNVDYGAAKKGPGKRRAIKNDAMPPLAWERFVRAWATNLLRYVEGPLYICMSGKEWPTMSRVLVELGGHWSTTIIWAKDRFVLGRSDYQRQYEPIWYGWREGAAHGWHGGRDQGDVWNIDRPSDSDLHPTMKPLELVERAIENSSGPGDSVLDLFLGSGTTLIAAERTGRTCCGMELEPLYVSLAIARWEAFTGGEAVRDGST